MVVQDGNANTSSTYESKTGLGGEELSVLCAAQQIKGCTSEKYTSQK